MPKSADMSDRDWLSARFEQERPQLRRIAYRMLGTLDGADDGVQEAWLRLGCTDQSAIEKLGAWLTTVLGRVSLNRLRHPRARREDSVMIDILADPARLAQLDLVIPDQAAGRPR
jgi:RNA polymerase sigma-70 factor, ECF subfamily